VKKQYLKIKKSKVNNKIFEVPFSLNVFFTLFLFSPFTEDDWFWVIFFISYSIICYVSFLISSYLSKWFLHKYGFSFVIFSDFFVWVRRCFVLFVCLWYSLGINWQIDFNSLKIQSTTWMSKLNISMNECFHHFDFIIFVDKSPKWYDTFSRYL
jgi:hypothetical protein